MLSYPGRRYLRRGFDPNLSHNLIDVTTIIQTAEHPIWLPSIESTRCFCAMSPLLISIVDDL